jgi:mono/diheme cytochrome c family protein
MHKNTPVLLCALVVSGALLFGEAQEHDQHAPAKPSPSGQKPGPHGEGTHTHAAAAKISNPVKPEEASIAAGEKLYAMHCAACHGLKGAGDGVQASKFTPRPSNLADAQWKHGPSDGEIFTVIRNGVPKTSMSAYSKKITERETWDVVNFLRSLGPKTDPAHAH